MKAVVVISVLLSVLLFHGRVHAQVYPCAGAGPGEIMVGEQPASNGVGAIPLCQRVAAQESPAPQQPVYRGPPPGVFGALAADDATGMYSSKHPFLTETMHVNGSCHALESYELLAHEARNPSTTAAMGARMTATILRPRRQCPSRRGEVTMTSRTFGELAQTNSYFATRRHRPCR